MDYEGRDKHGFTIVELLIVIVIIGILAAITVVAYRGITAQAAVSTVKGNLQTVQHALETYGSTNDAYPIDLATVGANSTNGVTYQYSYDNSATPRTWCVTATSGAISYYMSNATTTAQSGGCPGHGVGGVAAVTNQMINPNFSGPDGPTIQTGATCSGNITYSGSQMVRAVTTTASAASCRLQLNTDRWNISSGQSTYGTVTVYNASSGPRLFGITIRYYDLPAGSSSGTELGTSASSGQTIDAGSSYTFTVSGTAPASTQSAGMNVNRNTSGLSAIGDTYYADNAFLGSAASGYADGDSPGWLWNGTPEDSTSTGPVL